jgi:uncharacterized protein DUF2752
MPSGRSRGWRIAAVAAVLPALFAASYAYRPRVEDGPIVCGSRLLWGVPCPGCGLTRAFCFMSHGEFEAALRFNALAPVAAAYLGALWLYYLLFAARGVPPAWPTDAIASSALVVSLTYWAGRLTEFFACGDGLGVMWRENGVARLLGLF